MKTYVETTPKKRQILSRNTEIHAFAPYGAQAPAKSQRVVVVSRDDFSPDTEEMIVILEDVPLA